MICNFSSCIHLAIMGSQHFSRVLLIVLDFFHRAFIGFNFQTHKFALFILLVLICNVLFHLTYYVTAKVVFREINCWPPPKVLVFTVLTLLCWAAALLVFTLLVSASGITSLFD